MTSLYAQLCGVGAALFSGYYPFVNAKSYEKPAQSMAMILNAGAAYLVTMKVAELVKPRLEQLFRISIQSQPRQAALVVASIGFLYVLPGIVAKAKEYLPTSKS